MKLVSYLKDGHDQLSILVDDYLYDLDLLHPDMPNSMSMFLNYWEDSYAAALRGEAAIKSGRISNVRAVPLENVQLLSPVPSPTSCRDGYAFRQHV